MEWESGKWSEVGVIRGDSGPAVSFARGYLDTGTCT